MAGGSMKSVVAGVVGLVLASSSFAAQGGRQGRADAGPVEPGVSPAEVQRMFDAYALMQAQEQLKIGDEQFTQFLTRYKALQDVRRRTLQGRARVVMELRRLLNQPQPDDSQIRDRLKTLQEIDARGATDEKQSYEAIDQVLDVRQQAKFRVFEEVMERRKLELIGRARLANRPRNQQ
jgi:Spy/CpxP family protein refolding chaperone